MIDFESEYITLRTQLIEKYGEQTFKNHGAKSVALFYLSENFRRIPSLSSFAEEIEILRNSSLFITAPEVKIDFNERQENFRESRYWEIVKEDKENRFKIFKNKRNGAEALALSIIQKDMLNEKLLSGHIMADVSEDLYKLYLIQYQLYNQNPNHPIFVNAIMGNLHQDNPQNESISQPDNKKGGCLGVLILLVLIFSIAIILR